MMMPKVLTCRIRRIATATATALKWFIVELLVVPVPYALWIIVIVIIIAVHIRQIACICLYCRRRCHHLIVVV